MRENAAAKARRIEVHHDVGTCTCPARGRCSHLLAVELVTATDRKDPKQ